MSKLRCSENSSVNKHLAELHLGGVLGGGDTKRTNREINKIPKEIIQRMCGNRSKDGGGTGYT